MLGPKNVVGWVTQTRDIILGGLMCYFSGQKSVLLNKEVKSNYFIHDYN